MTETASRAHLLFEAAERMGWSNAAEVAEFARRLDRGLPAEDELAVIFHWLGRCKLVHKLDQFLYPPGSSANYRVPDLIAVFDVDGASVTVLIEVKKSLRPSLSWKPEYQAGLLAYADLLGVPLLIAWKYRTFWTLFEARHLRKATKNLNISFSKAMSETLLGLLAGDFSFSFQAGVGMHLKMRKLKKTDDGFDGVIEEAYFLNSRGERHTGAGGIMQLFACIDQEVVVKEDDMYVTQSFVVQEEGHAEFAHRALVTLLETFDEVSRPVLWRQILYKDQLPLPPTSPQEVAKKALDAGFVRYILNIRPRTHPSFVGSTSREADVPELDSANK